MATASWYVGLRTGGGGGAGGATGAAGFVARTGAFDGFTGLEGFDDLVAVRTDEPRDGGRLAGRRRSAWALFFAIRAGLRAEIRGLVTRRGFAIGGILVGPRQARRGQ